MLQFFSTSKSRSFQAVCFCFLLGVLLASVFDIRKYQFGLYLVILLLIICLVSSWKRRKHRTIIILLLVTIIGLYRYVAFFPGDSLHHIARYVNREVDIRGVITTEPDVRISGVNYILETKLIDGNRGEGSVYFKSGLYPRYSYGDQLKLVCKLKKPRPIEDFRYDMYLASKRVFVTCSRSKIEYIGSDNRFLTLSSLYKLKNVVAKKINLLWNEPQASFMAGLLYGYRGGLGSLNEDFNRTGVTHIVAVSGYNITIVVNILITIFVQLGLTRKRAFILIIICVILFTLFAGASASVVRAAIMGLLVVASRQFGRMSSPFTLLLLTATAMSIVNPLLLIWDAGFQLSFLSTCGLVYLTPKIKPFFLKVPEKLAIRESLVSTLSATVFTLPLIIYQFNRVSIVSIIVNMLVLPALPIIMLLGFFALVTSIVSSSAGMLLAYVSNLGLLYIVKVVRAFSSLSFASVEFAIPLYLCLLMYLVIIYYLIKDKWLKKLFLRS